MDQLLTDGQIRVELKDLNAKASEQARIIEGRWGSVDNARDAIAYDDDARRLLRDLTRFLRETSELEQIVERRQRADL